MLLRYVTTQICCIKVPLGISPLVAILKKLDLKLSTNALTALRLVKLKREVSKQRQQNLFYWAFWLWLLLTKIEH